MSTASSNRSTHLQMENTHTKKRSRHEASMHAETSTHSSGRYVVAALVAPKNMPCSSLSLSFSPQAGHGRPEGGCCAGGYGEHEVGGHKVARHLLVLPIQLADDPGRTRPRPVLRRNHLQGQGQRAHAEGRERLSLHYFVLLCTHLLDCPHGPECGPGSCPPLTAPDSPLHHPPPPSPASPPLASTARGAPPAPPAA